MIHLVPTVVIVTRLSPEVAFALVGLEYGYHMIGTGSDLCDTFGVGSVRLLPEEATAQVDLDCRS